MAATAAPRPASNASSRRTRPSRPAVWSDFPRTPQGKSRQNAAFLFMLRRGKLEHFQDIRDRMTAADDLLTAKPDKTVSARTFGVESDMKIPAFSKKTEYVPDIDDAYR